MADDAKNLTSDEVSQFLVRAGSTAPCPSCGQNAWIIPGQEKERIVGLYAQHSLRTAANYFPPASIIPAFVILCENCGFIRLHSVAIIWEKIRGAILYPDPPPSPPSDKKVVDG